ncbi:MAG: hypothetical protein IKN42_00885 [Elusimicrobia bacterium]|nr:hypothetical protein [Elusimicrobiota bacterium]
MNFKKFISLLFIMLLGVSSFVFAANNNRNVYSVYSDNFIGAHIYGDTVSIPGSDTDGIKFYPWKATWITPNKIIMSATTIDSADDPAPEGKQYMRYLWGSAEDDFTTTYVGCSYTRVTNMDTETSIDMSAYAGGKIKFSARSDKEYAKKCKIGFKLANGTENWFSTPLSSLNETWQEFSYDIPSGVGNVSVLFMAMIDGEPAHTIGEPFLDIDNIRWVKSSGTASFSVVRKNISDNQETTDPVSFSEDTFGQGWRAADQYLEMDIDGEFTNNNWTVRIYSSNDIAGLYNSSDPDNVLPMAWKISWTTLPFNYTDDEGQNKNSFEIGENKNAAGELLGLYDAGKVSVKGDGAKWWYPWFFVQKNADSSVNSLVINNVGCHTFENTNSSVTTDEYFDTPVSSYATDTYERKPKLFLACDTKKAKSLKYEANLVLNLSYE